MKKKLIAAAVTACMGLSVGAAFAAPVELDGDVKVHFRRHTYNYKDDEDGGKFTLRLNAKTALSEDLDLYARFAAQKLTGDKIGPDFDTDKYGDDVASLDQFGVVFKNGNFSYKLGRQGVSITPTALLYSSEGYLAENMAFLDGLVATGKSGVTDLQLVVGKGDVWGDSTDVLSLHGSVPVEKWTLGATVATADGDVADNTYYGADASYALGKANFTLDYLKSDAHDDNQAMVFCVSYAFNDKHSLSVYSHKTEANSQIATDWDPGEKGMYYMYDYKFDDEMTLSLLFKDNEEIDGDNTNTSLRATVTYKL